MRKVYPPDVFPGAWVKLDELVASGRVISVENVQQELAGQDDEVFRWAVANPAVFLALTSEIQLQAAIILNDCPTLIDPRRPRSNADPFIIAVAMCHRCILVADEVPSGSPLRHKIPDVCRCPGDRASHGPGKCSGGSGSVCRLLR